MCEQGGDLNEQAEKAPHRRKKLWEISGRLHCSVVGTCLTLADLRRIASKLRLVIPDDADDYDIHSHFVGNASDQGPLSKAMHKALDRQYAATIRRFGRAKDGDSLVALWNQCREEGDVPGPYWALVTHPCASENIVAYAYRHIHMLSHLVGAMNWTDLRRFRHLETERDALAEELTRFKRRFSEREADVRRLVESHAAEVRDLTHRLRIADLSGQRLDAAETRIRTLENGEAHRALQFEIDTLGRRLAETNERAERAATLESEVEELRRVNGQFEDSLQTVTAECEALEAALDATLDEGSPRRQAAMNLDGRRIVYVGGRARLIPRLRALVQDANGVFIHHDGGIEENGERLSEIVARGDAILCPVDCVSHTACQLAKRLCKRNAKAFVPLRSSGLSSFVGGLRQIAIGPELMDGNASGVSPH